MPMGTFSSHSTSKKFFILSRDGAFENPKNIKK
jgi:hypothetical protein